MSNETIIEVNNVSMEFNLSEQKTDNLKEFVIKFLKRELHFQSFWALNNVSLRINKGDRVGFLGLNGAGKSTLLKIISGVLKPTKGEVKIYGTMAPLLALGAGFDPNFSGKDNIFLNGAVLGHSRVEMEERYDDIVEFAELEDFIDVPIKNYSSGMKSRLAFAIATSVNPDILILDEVLSVGDMSFQRKSKDRMNNVMSDATLLFVSHSVTQVRNLCDKAIWLHKGSVIAAGEVNEICNQYETYVKNL